MKMIYKFNGGNGAILCNNCGKIIMSGSQIPQNFKLAALGQSNETLEDIGPQFCCEECKEKFYNLKNEEYD